MKFNILTISSIHNTSKCFTKLLYSILQPKIDVLDENGIRKGYSLERKLIHEKGEFHRAVHIYVFDLAMKNILLQKRGENVDHYPNMYSISVVGHVDEGENSYESAKRELKEELGIVSENLEFHFSYKREAKLNDNYIDRQFNDLYVTKIKYRDIKEFKIEENSVSSLKWVKIEDFIDMVLSNDKKQIVPVYKDACKDLFYFLKLKTNSVENE